MSSYRPRIAFVLAAALGLSPLLCAQEGGPHIGYIFPAGGRAGSDLKITVGGQHLKDVSNVHFSGEGVQATIIKHKRHFDEGEANRVRMKLDEARLKLEKTDEEGRTVGKAATREEIRAKAIELELTTEDELMLYDEFAARRDDEKRQLNPQLMEEVSIQVKIDPAAAPGRRDLRLLTDAGLSNPLAFHVSSLPEYTETEPNDRQVEKAIEDPMPYVLNGQIMPGDVDRFRLKADKGDHVVVSVQARDLIPYLADAVPGWFQATVGLYDETGREVAYEDDFQFHPDPVLHYKIPQEGFYELEIKDSIYRGREDFVYRITVGELPFITSIFPLGGRAGSPATVEVLGWNLPVESVQLEALAERGGVVPVSVRTEKHVSNEVNFIVEDFEELMEQEPNDDRQAAQLIRPSRSGLVINGRIDQPGDWDVYSFEGRKNGQVMLEVQARRLNSPLDSLVKVTDKSGRQLAINDDFVDKGTGLVTHHADSVVHVTLPEDGTFFVHVGDTQKKGGPAYAYRLRVSARRPDFDLRVTPSTINALPGSAVPITVFAIRKDDFNGEIAVALKDGPAGFELEGGLVPANQDECVMTLTVPRGEEGGPVTLELEGSAEIKGRDVRRRVVPADDWMQAFLYRHLVPAQHLVVAVSDKAARRSSGGGGTGGAAGEIVRIPAGGVVPFPIPLPDVTDLEQVKLELVNPPEGISIDRFVAGLEGINVLFRADPSKARPGLEGSLVLRAYVERPIPFQKGRTRRVPVGSIPAIRFQVTGG